MRPLVIALHGILTGQTDPSWPDRLDSWMFRRDPSVRVLKKEYRAGPFPRWNCYLKNPRLARSLANEIELFTVTRGNRVGQRSPSAPFGESDVQREGSRDDNITVQSKMGAAARSESAALPTRDGAKSAALPVGSRETESEPEADPAIWFVAHSNGAVIALRAAQRLIERGCPVSGLILTGAACEADVLKNRILEWVSLRRLGVAIAYASEDDRVLSGDPAHDPGPARGVISRVRARLWGRLIRPYGCLGRTGWLCGGRPLDGAFGSAIFTRWFPGGHSAYFAPERIHETFERIYGEIIGQGRAAPGERGLPSKAAEPSPTDKEAR